MILIDNSVKTNWKFIGIIAIIATLFGGWILILSLQEETPSLVSVIKKPDITQEIKPLEDETADWQTYLNEEFGFEVKYPLGENITKTEYGLRMSLPIEESGTNLSEKYLDIAVDSEPPHTGQFEWQGNVLLEGNLFIKEGGISATAGNIYETESYTINREGKKYILSFTLHSGNISNYRNPPEEFNKEKESSIFDQIFSTFRFIE